MGLDDVGCGTIHNSGPDTGNMHAIQGLRITGAVEILHLLASLLHGLSDGTHQRGFANARPSFKDQKIMEVLRPAEAGKQGLKPLAAVRAQEKMGRTCHEFSSQLIGFSLHNMHRGRAVTVWEGVK